MMKEKDVAKVPLDAVPSKLMTVQELSEYLHVHKSTIYRMLRQREFPGFRIGSDWRFNIEAVDRWVQSKAHTSISFRDRLNGGMPNAASAGVVGCATPSDPATMRDCATRRTQNCTILDTDAQAKALRVRI